MDANDLDNTLQYTCSNMVDQEYTTKLSAIESMEFIAMKPYKVKNVGWANMPSGFRDSLLNEIHFQKKCFFNTYNPLTKWSKSLKHDVIDSTYKFASLKLIKYMYFNAKIGDI